MSRRGLAAVASVLDQAASSATNILVLVLAARLSSASGFAGFSMVYVTFSVLLGLNMAYVGQSLVLEKGELLGARCRSAVGFTAASSAAVGALLLVVGLALSGATGTAFLALGLVLPLVLLQDGLRYCFSALRAPERALAADALRLVCVVAALAVQPEGASAGRLVLAWGLSALAGARARTVAAAAVRTRHPRGPAAVPAAGSPRTAVRGRVRGGQRLQPARRPRPRRLRDAAGRRRAAGCDHALRPAERAVQLRERLRAAGTRQARRQAGHGPGHGRAGAGPGGARRGLGDRPVPAA